MWSMRSKLKKDEYERRGEEGEHELCLASSYCALVVATLDVIEPNRVKQSNRRVASESHRLLASLGF